MRLPSLSPAPNIVLDFTVGSTLCVFSPASFMNASKSALPFSENSYMSLMNFALSLILASSDSGLYSSLALFFLMASAAAFSL